MKVRIRRNNILILFGLCLAFFGAAKAAPTFVQAFSDVDGSRYAGFGRSEWSEEVQPLHPITQINYELENIEGLSPSFTARMDGLPELLESLSIPKDEIREKGNEPAAIKEVPTTQLEGAPIAKTGEAPIHITIPSIKLSAPVVPARLDTVNLKGEEYTIWQAPDYYAVGWHDSSALLGETGNTVLNGHHNIYGEVFRDLIDVEIGDKIVLLGPRRMYSYIVANKMILPEKYEQIDTRMENARWILPSDDERLTLISCWPYESNSHRLIIVARPVE
jgi:LPXTG-site transpeptidase (sortase) family protein